jgi:3-phenylpropionate/cinnamic acid dioxygenase small subunit
VSAPNPDDAIDAARALKARYIEYLDGQRWDEWAELFAPDAVMDATEDMVAQGHPAKYGYIPGRDRIVAGSSGELKGARTKHHATEISIEEVEPGVVQAQWAMTDRLEYPDGRVLDGAGTYHDEYRLIDGRWMIQRLRLARTKLDWTPAPDA